jgi:hypothetical protein
VGGQPAQRADSVRPPQDWPALFDWEGTFDDDPDMDGVTEDDRYGEIGPLRPATPSGTTLVTSDGSAAESEAVCMVWSSLSTTGQVAGVRCARRVCRKVRSVSLVASAITSS